jgi:hypothetical protein
MVEYAMLVAQSASMSLGSFARAAEVWLTHLNWTVIGYAALGLVALRVAVWAFKPKW